MTGFARLVMAGLLAVMTLGVATLPAAAQGGVGFQDMPGIQQAVTRTFSSPDDRDRSAGTENPRDLRKPLVALLLMVHGGRPLRKLGHGGMDALIRTFGLIVLVIAVELVSHGVTAHEL